MKVPCPPFASLLSLSLVFACSQKAPEPPPPASAMEAAPQEKPAYREVPVTTRSPHALDEYIKARDLIDHNRTHEAVAGLKRAIALDPGFATAHAELGYALNGPEGLSELRLGESMSKSLPEPERLLIQLHLYEREGNRTGHDRVLERLFSLAPDDFRVGFEQGQKSFSRNDWQGAVLAYSRSVAAKQNCNSLNNLGYALAMEGKFDLAASAFKRCMEIAPNEPNSIDSLGELYLAQGKPDEARAEFQKAADLDPKFWTARHGLAAVAQEQNDWPHAFQYLKEARVAADLLPADRLEIDVLAAWALLAHGEGEAALKKIAAMEDEAKRLKGAGEYDYAHASLTRSAILFELGRYQEAIAAADTASARAASAQLPGAVVKAVTLRALVRRAMAEATLNRPKDARATLAKAEAAVAASPISEADGALHVVRAAIARAEGDLKRARAELSQCPWFGMSLYSYDFRYKPMEGYCHWQLFEVEQRLGDVEAAKESRATLLQRGRRDPVDLYIRSRLEKTQI